MTYQKMQLSHHQKAAPLILPSFFNCSNVQWKASLSSSVLKWILNPFEYDFWNKVITLEGANISQYFATIKPLCIWEYIQNERNARKNRSTYTLRNLFHPRVQHYFRSILNIQAFQTFLITHTSLLVSEPSDMQIDWTGPSLKIWKHKTQN